MSEKPPLDWFGNPMPIKSKGAHSCIDAHGAYNDPNEQCGNCQHIVRIYASNPIYDCRLREARGDWRLSYPACAKFEERVGPIELYRRGGVS
jgi:hypothetical protein